MISNKYLIAREDLVDDELFELSYELFKFRNQRKFGLWEVANRTHLSVEEIDRLETGIGAVNFKQVGQLLDFYEKRLSMTPDCIPGLPDSFYKKYFTVAEEPQ